MLVFPLFLGLATVDCRRAIVSWYTRLKDVPTSALKYLPTGVPPLAPHNEVLLEERQYDNDIDADTILGKCQVRRAKCQLLSKFKGSSFCFQGAPIAINL